MPSKAAHNVLLVSPPLDVPHPDASRVLARTLVRHAPEVRFTAPTAGGEMEFENLKAEQIYNSTAFGLGDKFRLFLRIFKPDSNRLLHFFFQPNRRTALMSRLAVGMRGHDPTIQTLCAAPASADAGVLFADVNVAVSRATQAALAASKKEVRCILPAVEEFDPSKRGRRAEVRSALGLPANAIAWVYPGDVEHSDAALQLVKSFPSGDDRLRLVLACREKTKRSRARNAELRRLTEDAGIADKVILAGQVDDLSTLLAACDGLVFPVETLFAKMDIPLALLEGMAVGLPVIVSDLPSLLEAVEHGVNGLVVPAGDARAAWNAASTLDSDGAELGGRAAETVRDNFNPRRMAEKYLEVYRELDWGK